MKSKLFERACQLHTELANLHSVAAWLEEEKDRTATLQGRLGERHRMRGGDLFQLPADITEAARRRCFEIAAADLQEQIESRQREFDQL